MSDPEGSEASRDGRNAGKIRRCGVQQAPQRNLDSSDHLTRGLVIAGWIKQHNSVTLFLAAFQPNLETFSILG